MLIMILELLGVGFVLGLCLTAFVLAAISGADALLRVRRPHLAASRGAAVHTLAPRRAGLAHHAGRSGHGHTRAA